MPAPKRVALIAAAWIGLVLVVSFLVMLLVASLPRGPGASGPSLLQRDGQGARYSHVSREVADFPWEVARGRVRGRMVGGSRDPACGHCRRGPPPRTSDPDLVIVPLSSLELGPSSSLSCAVTRPYLQ